MKRLALGGLVAVATMSCGGGDNSAHDAAVDAYSVDAPDTPPTLTSFYPTPAQVTPGVPTAITWSWTYQVDPPAPTPTCTIDNGIGEVTRGQMTMVTLNATTAYRLTCTNRVGMTARDSVIMIPPAAPTLATFTATPSPVMPSAATTVAFNWTYANVPSPPPTCTIDAGIGAATQGMTASLTLPQARTYRLRCQNTQGVATRDVTVAVDECTGGTHDCGANATCTDTTDSFTCGCNNGYVRTAANDQCSATNLACSTPGVCSTNATCVNAGTTCQCNAGYIGDGVTCTRARQTFITSTTGTGNVSTWLGATGTGLAAADSICAARATAAGLTGTYVAWMSDANNDAYCRVHGLTGKKANSCGQAALPATAGPWVRTDAARLPAAPRIDTWLAPTRQTFYPVTYNESGTDVTTTPQLIWTGTDDTGVLTGGACTDWTSTAGTGAMGDLSGGGTSWTDQGTDPTCSSSGRLRCVEVAAGSGPTLPSRHPANAKKAFLTSVVGTGAFGTWADAQGLTGISAADAICQARARYAGYSNAASFKAWASYSSLSVVSRITNNSVAWYRPDGIQIAASETDMTDGRLLAPLYMTETNAYASGNAETGSVWTGSYYYGSTSSYTCSSWASSASSGSIGRFDVADFRWVAVGTSSSSPSPFTCSATDYRLYCVEDSP